MERLSPQQKWLHTLFSLSFSIHKSLLFFTFTKDWDKMDRCEIRTIDVSDHSPVYLTVNLSLQKMNNIWKLNSGLLDNQRFKQQIRKEITYVLDFNENGEVSPPMVWDTLKSSTEGKNYSNVIILEKK